MTTIRPTSASLTRGGDVSRRQGGLRGRASLGLSPAIRTAQAEIDTPPSLARPASPARWDVTAAQSALVVGDEAAVTRPRTLTAGGGTAVWATAAAVPRIVPETDRTTAMIEASTRRRCVVSLLLDGPHRAAGVSEHRQRFLHGRSTRAGLDRGRAGGDGGPPPLRTARSSRHAFWEADVSG